MDASLTSMFLSLPFPLPSLLSKINKIFKNKKYALPHNLVRGTDLFSLRLSNKKNDNTIAIWYEIKIIPIFFLVRLAKNIFLGVPQNFSN